MNFTQPLQPLSPQAQADTPRTKKRKAQALRLQAQSSTTSFTYTLRSQGLNNENNKILGAESQGPVLVNNCKLKCEIVQNSTKMY